MTPLLLVLSSPSGGGKSTIARRLLERRTDLGYSVSATTRSPRGGEQDGTHYHFLARAEFERRVAAGDFLEWATYGGNLYGTLRAEIDRLHAGGRHAVLDIEVEGARQLRRSYPQAVHVFILPPSAPILLERLTGRGTESPEVIATRLRHAVDELGAIGEYDFVVRNDDLDTAVAQVAAIIEAESCRLARQELLPRLAARLAEELRQELDGSAAGAARAG
ncbi:MAG: guanylate kinase [Gemmatimonadales bacterium]|nr:guanylate kinase [Gemmatimonadales bacterium]